MRSLWLRLWKFLPSLLVAERFDTLMKGDRRSGRRCRLQLENLESRELLNSAPIAYDSSLSVVHNQSAWATAMYSDPDSGDSVSVSGYSQPAHGSVTFDGIDQFTYTPTTGYKGEDSFTFTVSDGQASAVGTFFLTVTNTAPEVYDSSFGLTHDQPTSFWPSYYDADGDTVTISGYTQPAHGTISFDGQNFTYTPAVHFTGQDSMTYTVTDGIDSSTAEVLFTLSNRAPEVYDSSMDQLHDQSMSFWPMFSDPDGDSVSVSGYTQPAHGSLTFDSQSQNFTYTPAAGYVGLDSFTYSASDGIATTTATVTLTIYNNAPTLDDMTISLLHDQSTSFWPMYSDPDYGDTVTLSGYTQPAHGTVTTDGMGGLIYTPATGYVGSDSLTVTVTDGIASTTATVYLTVTNQAPTVSDTTMSLLHDQPTSIYLMYSDPDYGDTVTISSYSQPAHGTVASDGMGGLLYTPAAGYVGEDSLTVTVTDGIASAAATVYLTITNQAPTTSDINLSLVHDRYTSIWPSFSDPDGDTVTVSSYSQPAHGTLSYDSMSNYFSYFSEAGYIGSDSFTFTVSDTVDSSTAAVYLTITNQPPTANDQSYTTSKTAAVFGNVLMGASDADGDTLTLSAVNGGAVGTAALSSGATLAVSSDGSFTYDPATSFTLQALRAGETASDSFTFSVSDGAADTTATVTITVAGSNLAPEAYDAADSVQANDTSLTHQLDGDLTWSVYDAENDPLTWELVTMVATGTLTWPGDGTYTYVPAAGYVGDVTFSYYVSDGQAQSQTATVTISVVDAAPVAAADEFWGKAGQSFSVAASGVLDNDYDDDMDALTAVLVSGAGYDPQHGTVALAADGSFDYEPTDSFVGDDTFYYQAFDGVSSSAIVAVVVHLEDDAPEGSPDTYYVSTGGTLSATATNVLANDDDPSGDPISAVLVNGPSYATAGSFQLNADGTFSYTGISTPPPEFPGTDSFTYKTFDGTLYSDPITVTIVWSDKPIGEEDAYLVPDDGNLTISLDRSVLANDHTVDGYPMTAQLVQPMDPNDGTLVFNADGTFSFTAGANFLNAGSVQFSYQAIVPATGQISLAILVKLLAAQPLILNTLPSTLGLKEVYYRQTVQAGQQVADLPTLLSDVPTNGRYTRYTDPQWVDLTLNGSADDNGDSHYPAAIPSGQFLALSARFPLDASAVPLWRSLGQADPTGRRLYRVRADGPGNFDLGYGRPVLAYLDDSAAPQTYSLVVNRQAIDNAFPANQVQYFQNFQLHWQISPDGGANWVTPQTANTSSNELFVTFGLARTPSLYYTVVKNGTVAAAAAGANTQAAVIDAVFSTFTNQDFARASDGMPLRYYGSWATRRRTVATLIQLRDGTCGTWADLFQTMLEAQGITTGVLKTIHSRDPNEYIVVGDSNSWLFGDTNIPDAVKALNGILPAGFVNPLATTYTHFNRPGAGTVNGQQVQDIVHPPLGRDSDWAYSSARNEYQWTGTSGVREGQSIPGQNQSHPHSIFATHVVVQIGNTLYDPSYGKTYTSLQDFENRAIAGYMRQIPLNERRGVDFNQDGRLSNVIVRVFLFRQKQAGQLGLVIG